MYNTVACPPKKDEDVASDCDAVEQQSAFLWLRSSQPETQPSSVSLAVLRHRIQFLRRSAPPQTTTSSQGRDTRNTETNSSNEPKSIWFWLVLILLVLSCFSLNSLNNSVKATAEVVEELKMVLVKACSANKCITRTDSTLTELIEDNYLNVLLVTETWSKMEKKNSEKDKCIKPQKYTIFNVKQPLDHKKKREGSVAVIVRDDLQPKQMKRTKNMSLKEVNKDFPPTIMFEYVAVSVTPPRSREPVLILNIYRPPSGSFSKFSEEFELLMSHVYAKFKNIIIGGDFNVDDNNDIKAQRSEMITASSDLVEHLKEPTHNVDILDLVLANSNVRITDVSVQNNRFSNCSTVFIKQGFKLSSANRTGLAIGSAGTFSQCW